MRLVFPIFALAAAIPGFPARAEAGRSLVIAPVIGLRSFESSLDLEDEAAIGLRFGMNTSERISVVVDYLHSVPARESTGQLAYITSLRTLGQVRLMTGPLRPYIVAGVGGVLFNFSDANDTAGGALTLGAGVEIKPWRRTALFLEGSTDLYRTREVVYSTTGDELSVTPRRTDQVTSVTAGVSVEF